MYDLRLTACSVARHGLSHLVHPRLPAHVVQTLMFSKIFLQKLLKISKRKYIMFLWIHGKKSWVKLEKGSYHQSPHREQHPHRPTHQHTRRRPKQKWKRRKQLSLYSAHVAVSMSLSQTSKYFSVGHVGST